MIVCSCNLLTEADIRSALRQPNGPDCACEVYAALGCSQDCGGCAGSIACMVEEARLANLCAVAPAAKKAA